ncbi:MAG: hypothetical protein UZ22_OP11002000710 [Microgenomates bacterium OLB23]|nr:MAG: hypothetical protein UZ22_OP11002000710 [Microgenomates bacterium OLB23]
MFKPLMKAQKGFTLVEILIVVSLIAILAVVALITINPAEAQRRARDTQRIKDISSLQSIMEQYLSDNSSVTSLSVRSLGGTNACDNTGWVGVDLCAYANTLPTDPTNRTSVVAVTDAGGTTTAGAAYTLILNSQGQYRICTRMESRANVAKLTTDGEPNNFFEVFSYTGVSGC